MMMILFLVGMTIGLYFIIDALFKIAGHLVDMYQHNQAVKEVAAWKAGRQLSSATQK
jgi:hypothetical protein